MSSEPTDAGASPKRPPKRPPKCPSRPLAFRRIDPARNMARFYLLALQPTLFGDVSLVRNWGRIGTRGQAKVETFATADEAEAALRRIERAKRRRGYAAPGDG